MSRMATGLRRAGRLRDRLRRRIGARAIDRRLPSLIAELIGAGVLPGGVEPMAPTVLTRSGIAIARVGGGSGSPELLVKLALDRSAADGLRREEAVLRRLADQVTAEIRELIPFASGHLERNDGTFVRVESALPGTPALDHGPELTPSAQASLARALRALRGAAPRRPLGPADLPRLVDARAAAVERATGLGLLPIIEATRRAVSARQVELGAVHGDLWAGNLLVADGGATLTGIVDWDRFADHEPASIDTLHLLVTGRKRVTRREIGEIVTEHLSSGDDGANADWLLYWLWFASANLERYPGLAKDRWWVRRNVLATAEACR